MTDADQHGRRERATVLAERCVAEAAGLGITIDDMEPEWAPPVDVIYQAMQNDLEAELQIWKAVAAARDRK